MKESGPRLGGGAFPAQGAQLLAEKDGCAVWQFQNESGEGTMTVYDVFPGVMLSFNDFHMARYESAYVAGRPLFAIDHCREGRMEYAACENAVAYTSAGDMKLDLRRQHTGVFRFPSSLYHSQRKRYPHGSRWAPPTRRRPSAPGGSRRGPSPAPERYAGRWPR